MGNRKLPFGYMMKMGKVVICPEETEIVRFIFHEYVKRQSYNQIVNELNKQSVHYDEDKPWNKNMVARILDDVRYTGETDYPKILESRMLEKAREIRARRPQATRKTETQKALRQLSGYTATPEIEQQVLEMLNRLAGHPKKIRQPEVSTHNSTMSSYYQRQFEEEISKQPIEETTILETIVSLASAKFNEIGRVEYETEKLRRQFSQKQADTKLDEELLRSSVASIHISRGHVVSIQLKNNQILYRGEEK